MSTKKQKCDQLKLKSRAEEYIEDSISRHPECEVYYTDGSYDPQTGRAASAFVCTSRPYEGKYRVSDEVSTLQTELQAIRLVLESRHTPPNKQVVIFTDSLSAIKVLDRTTAEPQNIELVNKIITAASNYDRAVEIHWIPSHIGLDGNERADELANEGLSHDKIDIEIKKTCNQQTREMHRNEQSSFREVLEAEKIESRALSWLANINNLQPWTNRPKLPQSIAKQVNALRLGVKPHTYENREWIALKCRYCKQTDMTPLHYLAECPELDTHRRDISLAADAENTLTNRELAATILRDSQTQISGLVKLLKLAPFIYAALEEVEGISRDSNT